MHNITFDRFIGKKVIGINDMYPFFIFEEDGNLMIECSWRLRDNKTILVGCSEYDSKETHKETHEKLLKLLIGQVVESMKLIPPVSDLNISFKNGLYLELFSDSNIYESWSLSDGEDFDLLSATAGQGCLFDA